MMDWKGDGEVSLTGWRFYLDRDTLDEKRITSNFVSYEGETLRQAIHTFVQDDQYNLNGIIGITPEDQRFDGLTKIETWQAIDAYREKENANDIVEV